VAKRLVQVEALPGSSIVDGPVTEGHSAGVHAVRLFGAGDIANFSTALGDEAGVETEGRLEMSLRLSAELRPATSTRAAGCHERVPAARRQKHVTRLCTRGIEVRDEQGTGIDGMALPSYGARVSFLGGDQGSGAVGRTSLPRVEL
jgi:hypothetical protein